MKNCIGVNPKAYSTDPEGRRLCPTPFLHYPDFCTFFPEASKEGDCYKNCDELPSAERPCYKRAFKLEEVEAPADPAPAPATPPPAPVKTQGIAPDGSVLPEGYYWCSKCKRPHDPRSKIGQKHGEYITEVEAPAEEPRDTFPAKENESPPQVQPTTSALGYREMSLAVIEQTGLEVLEKQIEELRAAMDRHLDQMHRTINRLKSPTK